MIYYNCYILYGIFIKINIETMLVQEYNCTLSLPRLENGQEREKSSFENNFIQKLL